MKLQSETTIVNHFQHELDQATVEFDTKLDWDISKLLFRTGLTLSVSETISGGMLSHRLSKFSRNNNFFHGGIICCHPLLTINICSVTPATLRHYGIASKQTALEMVRGLKKLTRTNICIAVAGMIFQNEQQATKKIKNVFLGFDINGKESVKSLHIDGTGNVLQNKTIQATLVYLRQLLLRIEQHDFATTGTY